jgi:hypothetical protein
MELAFLVRYKNLACITRKCEMCWIKGGFVFAAETRRCKVRGICACRFQGDFSGKKKPRKAGRLNVDADDSDRPRLLRRIRGGRCDPV